MTTESRRFRIGRCLAFLVLPILLVAGCTRASDSNDDGTDPADAAASSDARADDDGGTPATDRGDDTVPDTSPPDTSPPDPDDTTPATEPDSTDADSVPDDSDPPSSDSTVVGPSTNPGQDSDGDSTDPAVVTIGAIIGALLLLGVAALWMVRMDRTDEHLSVSGSTPPDDSR